MANYFRKLFNKVILPNKVLIKTFLSSTLYSPKSSLFISGERAVDTFVVVIPQLDFDQRFDNLSELEENIKRRKLNLNIIEMKESWLFYKEWNEKKLKLMENLKLVMKQINELSRFKEMYNKADLDKLLRDKDILQEELQQVKKNVWHMEDSIICELLKLPNILHPETPEKEEDIFVFDREHIVNGYNHLSKGAELNCLEYKNELTYFLKDKAALLELALPEMLIDELSKHGYIRFSNPDFTRSVLAEGVNPDPYASSELFHLENTESNNDGLHLCGGASLFPFCGFHAKHSVPKKTLPVKYVASGRCYSPVTSSLGGLYSVNQSTAVQLFIATSCDDEMNHEFQSCLKNVTDLFTGLGLAFKLVKEPAHFLKDWESLRVSIKVFSPCEMVFVEVGSVSLVNDFVSKRLRMYYIDKKEGFLKIVSGTVVNTQIFLALCLERSSKDLYIPDILNNYFLND